MIDLGDQPQPDIEPAEPPPGGVDALEDEQKATTPVVPDITGVGNTPSKDEIPDELSEPEDTETAATSAGTSAATSAGASDPESESPA
jgi:hypothetical protein